MPVVACALDGGYQIRDLYKIFTNLKKGCYRIKIVKIYERVNKFYINEEPYVSMNRFQFYLGCVERKLLKRKIEVSLFSSVSELEEVLGDMCYYDGEKTLLKVAASVDLHDKLKKYFKYNLITFILQIPITKSNRIIIFILVKLWIMCCYYNSFSF